MPAKKQSITRPYILEEFMRPLAKLQISEDAVQDFTRELDALAEKITVLSAKLARTEAMKTLMPRHIEAALDEVLRRGPLTLDELMEKIDPLSAVELSQLAERVKRRADELLKPKRRRNRRA